MVYPEISRHIVSQFKRAQEEKISSNERSKAVHVSDLTPTCIRKSWYNFHQPDIPLDNGSICNFFLGTILHENIALGKRNEVTLSANIRSMKPIQENEIGTENFYDCITGSIDDIIELDGESIIVDKKTTNRIPDEPSAEYVTQVNVYKLLLYINEGIEVKKGSILYLDKPSSFRETKCFVFDLMGLTEIKNSVVSKLDQLKSASEPQRVITSLCDWCPHLKACDPYQNGGFPHDKK